MKYLILLLLFNFQTITASNSTDIVIESSDQMKFNVTELKVKSGETINLTLVHTGNLPKVAMGHNWVLLEEGTDVRNFALSAMKEKDNEYVPSSGVIAATSLIGGGEQTSITFTAPAPGEYDFICSFPGHYGLMKGKLIVE
mgnify:CR=1 FL=1